MVLPGLVVSLLLNGRRRKKAKSFEINHRGDAELKKAIKAAEKGDLDPFDSLIRSRSDGGFVMGQLISSNVSTDQFRQWAQEHASSTRLSVLGQRLISDAWEIRGSGRATTVDENAWAPFHAGLEEADGILKRAAAADVSDVRPWASMTTTARGLGMSYDELRRRFDQGHRRSPFDATLCAATLQGMCAKWSGSHDKMFEFARWIDGTAPTTSAARQCLPLAHIERALSLDDGKAAFEAYLKQDHVVAEVSASAKQFLRAVPSPGTQQIEAFNIYAAALYPNDRASAEVTLQLWDLLNFRYTEWPWFYFGSAMRHGEQRRKQAKKARRGSRR